jgi:hypothetical protein
LSELVPFFNNRHPNQGDQWPAITAACLVRAKGKASDMACAVNMAGYHIFNDLVPALYNSACGSSSDWQKVYTAIEACTPQVGDTISPGAGSAAAIGTYAARTVARTLCAAGRAAAGKAISANPNLQGLVCTP